MPENIVAVEPEPSEPVIKDTADSSTMKYFIGIGCICSVVVWWCRSFHVLSGLA